MISSEDGYAITTFSTKYNPDVSFDPGFIVRLP
jgi:hypothetical protein